MTIRLTGIILYVTLLLFPSYAAMAEKPKGAEAEPELDEEGYVRGLTSEEIMNLPPLEDDEDEETAGMTIDEIIERANQRGNANQSEEGNIDGPYIVQGDIAMTKEEYEEHMAEWEKQKAELIAKGEMQPDK